MFKNSETQKKEMGRVKREIGEKNTDKKKGIERKFWEYDITVKVILEN